MKNTTLKFCNETIHPGEMLSLALPLPQLFSCAPLYMPIKLLHGKVSGPCILIIAAMYGNEINGTEIIHRLLSLPAIAKLKGTLIAIPVLNVHGLINRSRFLPGGINLNSHFPGNEHGTNVERLANIFVTEIFNKADVCINLQTGPVNCTNLPMVQFHSNDEKTMELAQAFNAPVMVKSEFDSGSLEELSNEKAKPFLTYLGGEAMRFDQRAIKVGVEGILNIMRKTGMLPEKITKSVKVTQSVLADNLMWVSASSSGTNHTKQKLGQPVKKGDLLCTIKDPFGTADNVTLCSPKEGIIVGQSNTPLAHEGDGLFQIAVFPEVHQVADHLEQWHQEQTVANG
ncbi:MAG: succinylglutamate desuccinylase/aspartoacylase family protein [Gammaproteobacteria bacterium]|nr:succinylglutamate desuccinylase/aspartoacylase family protein [Gammaproteobacteria bacterium]